MFHYVSQELLGRKIQTRDCSVKIGVLRNIAKFIKNTCAFSIKKETLAQVFSCESCEISKKTFFTEHL